MTSLADLWSSAIIRDNFLALHQAVEAVAAPPIWNVATIGGNICQNSRCLYYNQSKAWRLERPPCLKAGGNICHAVPKGKKCFSVYSGDLAPALIALRSTRLRHEKESVQDHPSPRYLQRQRAGSIDTGQGRTYHRPDPSAARQKKWLQLRENAREIGRGLSPSLSSRFRDAR